MLLKGVSTLTFSEFVAKPAHAGGMKYTMLSYTEPMQHPTATTVEPPLVELIDAIHEAPTSLAGPLARFAGGDETEAQAVVDELTPQIYAALKRVARAQLRHERADHTLQSTALVNEAYARMCEATGLSPRDRSHFFRLAARIMRHVLVDHARAKRAVKRGGDVHITRLDRTLTGYADHATRQFAARDPDATEAAVAQEMDFIALDQALQRLQALSPRQADVVHLRFFGDLSIEATAEVLGLSIATVKRDWAVARLFLQREIAAARDE